jgi:ABC-type protease/lipase transport system fused ATPase/permease subunit
LRQIGEGMHEILSRSVVSKTLRVSLLSNPEISGSQLLKMMQIDMEKIIHFPQIRSNMLANLYCLIFSIVVIAILFGIAGIIGVVSLVAILSIRFCLRKKTLRFEESLANETEMRVHKTV